MKVAAIFIIVAGSFMVIQAAYSIHQLRHPLFTMDMSEETIRLNMLIMALWVLVGCVNAVIGIGVLTLRRWVRIVLFVWTIMSAALIAGGTWAGQCIFGLQCLSHVSKICLLLFYFSAGYMLWAGRKRSSEA